MRIKQGVRLRGLGSPILLAVVAARELYDARGVELVITSATDGDHMSGSKHHCGDAVDLRSRTLDDPEAVTRELKDKLGRDFDVLYEGNHIHIEYDPK